MRRPREVELSQPRSEVAPEENRAVGYVSLGSGPVAPDRGTRFQAKAIEKACARRCLGLCEMVGDRPAPGSRDGDRPGLHHALERVVSGELGTLVVARLDCLGDSAAALGSVLEWFEVNDARLVAADLHLDTGTPAGMVVTRAMVAAGELERRKLGARTRRGLAAARRNGGRAGRPAVADRPDLRTRILELRAGGMTLQAIADRLNRDGVPTLRGGTQWRPSSVQAATGYTRPGRHKQLDHLPRPPAIGDSALDALRDE